MSNYKIRASGVKFVKHSPQEIKTLMGSKTSNKSLWYSYMLPP